MKHILSTIIALLMCASGNAQSLKDLLLAMPDEVCPLLSEYNRLELVDNQRNGKQMRTTNNLKTESSMATLTDTYARLKTTKNSEKVFKLLATNGGDTLIAVVSTVFIDDIPDSQIEFYDTQWRNIGTEGRIGFELKEGFHYIELKRDTDEMRFMTGTPLDIALDGSNRIEKPRASSVTLTWNGERFE